MAKGRFAYMNNPTDKDLGFSFIGESDTEARADIYTQVLPSTLIAVIPAALAGGSYRLAVRTISKGGERLEGVATVPIGIRPPT